jgi:hypothetical protein
LAPLSIISVKGQYSLIINDVVHTVFTSLTSAWLSLLTLTTVETSERRSSISNNLQAGYIFITILFILAVEDMGGNDCSRNVCSVTVWTSLKRLARTLHITDGHHVILFTVGFSAIRGIIPNSDSLREQKAPHQ